MATPLVTTLLMLPACCFARHPFHVITRFGRVCSSHNAAVKSAKYRLTDSVWSRHNGWTKGCFVNVLIIWFPAWNQWCTASESVVLNLKTGTPIYLCFVDCWATILPATNDDVIWRKNSVHCLISSSLTAKLIIRSQRTDKNRIHIGTPL